MSLIFELLTPFHLPFIVIVLVIACISIGFALYLVFKIRALPEGTDKMKEIAEHIREGSRAYLNRQFKTIIIIGAIIAVALGIGIDFLFYWRIGKFSMVSFAFLIGMACSFAAGYVAMSTATYANVRVTNKVKEEGLSGALKVAFNGGMIMGLIVIGLSLLAITILFLVLSALIIDPADIGSSLVGLAFGSSFTALFAILGGGIYTKAADVGADLVGKIEAGIPEDDPRNPGVIADNVGDNVGDIAGRGADLFESITGQVIAIIVLAIFLFTTAPAPYKVYALLIPLVSSALGLVATMLGQFFVRGKDTDEPWNILIRGLYSTMIINGVFFLIICLIMFPWPSALFFFGAAIVGLVASFLIGYITLYYTDDRYRPVKSISKATESGPATTIIRGLSVGLESVGMPVIIIVGTLIGTYFLGWFAGIFYGSGFTPVNGGLFGIAMGALGLYSVCGMVLSLDGYGPIVDNAGGIAEMAKLEEDVREETDRLDSCGNTTKAYTKGYAIATVIFTAILLFDVFSVTTEKIKIGIVFSLSDPLLLAGLLIGAVLVFVFSAFALRAVGESAQDLIAEIRRQFREIPGLKEGKEGVEPEYAHCVDICTVSALKHMIIPGSLVVLTPLIVGFTMGSTAVGGLLIGAIITGIVMALFLNTGGGALDNAKKLRKKMLDKSDPKSLMAYNAAIQGDIVGDPMKDTAGPSINVLLTLILTLATEFAILFAILPWFP